MKYLAAFLLFLTGYTFLYYGITHILPQFGATYNGSGGGEEGSGGPIK